MSDDHELVGIGSSVRALPVEPDRVLGQVDLADGVGVVRILLRAARLGLGHGVGVADKACCQREESNRTRFRHVSRAYRRKRSGRVEIRSASACQYRDRL
jgi:hypothetical protein